MYVYYRGKVLYTLYVYIHVYIPIVCSIAMGIIPFSVRLWEVQDVYCKP